MLFRVCTERGSAAFSWRQRPKPVTTKAWFSWFAPRLFIPDFPFPPGKRVCAPAPPACKIPWFYGASERPNLTLGPKDRTRQVRLQRTKLEGAQGFNMATFTETCALILPQNSVFRCSLGTLSNIRRSLLVVVWFGCRDWRGGDAVSHHPHHRE